MFLQSPAKPQHDVVTSSFHNPHQSPSLYNNNNVTTNNNNIWSVLRSFYSIPAGTSPSSLRLSFDSYLMTMNVFLLRNLTLTYYNIWLNIYWLLVVALRLHGYIRFKELCNCNSILDSVTRGEEEEELHVLIEFRFGKSSKDYGNEKWWMIWVRGLRKSS